jgi:hypothetical protein
MAIQIISNWRKAWKFASVQWSTVGFFVMAFIDTVDSLLSRLSPAFYERFPNAPVVAMIFLALSVIGRLFTFKGKEANGEQQP